MKALSFLLFFAAVASAQVLGGGSAGGGYSDTQSTSVFQLVIYIFEGIMALAATILFMISWFHFRRDLEHGASKVMGAALICLGLAITPYLVGIILPFAKRVTNYF
jgi:H+/Cl- antiporter ClcA